MSVGHKSSNTQLFRLMVYQRALHPELFELEGRRMYRKDDYEAETWICPAAHVARYQVNGQCLTESVIEDGDHLPEHGLVYALPCVGEKDYELEHAGKTDKIGYVTTIQTETLSDNLYMATYREMRDSADEGESLCCVWDDEGGANCFSLLDVQTYKREFHIQSYHLIGSAGMVLRTQSIFEIL